MVIALDRILRRIGGWSPPAQKKLYFHDCIDRRFDPSDQTGITLRQQGPPPQSSLMTPCPDREYQREQGDERAGEIDMQRRLGAHRRQAKEAQKPVHG
ncbi:MAG: hypothetical protein ABSF87_12875 [Xanthobacteraceae bacterium]